MPELALQLLQGDKVDSNTDYRGALAINVSGVVKPILGASGYLLECPGLTQLGTGAGVDRGGVWNELFENHFRLSGTSFIEVAADGTATTLGEILGSDTASMPYSFQTQAIIANGEYYLYDPVNGFREVVDADLGTPLDAVWVDGYYFFTDGDYLYHTDLDDESAIDPLKYATSEFSPDPTIGVSLTTDNKVIAWNRYTTEYFVNNANEFFAFTRIPSRNVSFGLVGTHCKTQIGGEWFFMGGPKEGNVSIYQLGVGTAKNISSRDVDDLIAKYTEAELSVCVLETRTVDNYPYLIVRLPDETVMLNLKVAAVAGVEQAWSYLQSGTSATTYRAIHGIFEPRLSKWVYGDTLGATIGYLDETVATHYTATVECVIYTPFVYLESASLDEISIQTIPGFTSTDDATVFVSLTYNGVTWSTESSVNSIQYGGPSFYNERFIVRRLGYVRNWFSLKLRWANKSRMAFSMAKLTYG